MSTAPHTTPFHSVGLAARVTTLLARTLPEYVRGVVPEGFRVESLDHQEPRRMFVRWHGGTPTRPMWTHGPALGHEKYKAQILEVLTRAGYAVTSVPGRMDVFVNDRPHETAGPRFAPVANDIPFTAPWLVMDLWTRAHVAVADTEEEAAAEAMRAERQHALIDARLVAAEGLWPDLERADELMGDGLAWLRREVHSVNRYSDLVAHERIDALVAVANALRVGREVTEQGRMVAWKEPVPMLTRAHPPLTYEVHWIPKSTAPTVGFFPGFRRGRVQDAAIAVLAAAGLPMVEYGEPIGTGAWLVERNGLMVTAAVASGDWPAGVTVDAAGPDGLEQTESVPQVLRAAGWTVAPERDWAGAWMAFPPAE
ncbi:hypothetical protein ACLQ2N_32995 [Streptomyces sp. DT224]|uniref:hypothetical protein n=1 Tax=Streptomyces sp. DT224 TaxID=3393426 RepID=UPI003CF704E3